MATTVKPASREWYRIRCEADADVAEIWIYDEIGEVMDFWTGEVSGMSAKKFATDLEAIPAAVKTLRVHVNSPGGDWADSIAIANMLRAQGRDKARTVEMLVEAIAASGATLITSAGTTIKIASNAVLMVHNPQGALRVIGEVKDIRSAADSMITAMETMRNSMVTTYRWVSRLSAEAIQGLMDAVTWMSAEQALANGFATEIMDPVDVEVRFHPQALDRLGDIPEQYRERITTWMTPPQALIVPADASVGGASTLPPGTIEPAQEKRPATTEAPVQASSPDILAAVEQAGLGVGFARELLAAALTSEEVTARIAEAQTIRGLCAAAKLPELADSYIAHRMPVAAVQAQLTTLTARMDAVEITTALPADGDRPLRPASRLNPSAVYAERRARVGQRGA